jgi:hypothetical protein
MSLDVIDWVVILIQTTTLVGKKTGKKVFWVENFQRIFI